METPNLTKKRIEEYLKREKRFDGRGLLDYRKIEIETNVSKNAEGSARVMMLASPIQTVRMRACSSRQ